MCNICLSVECKILRAGSFEHFFISTISPISTTIPNPVCTHIKYVVIISFPGKTQDGLLT